jgi:hypothetical protein
MCPRTYLATLNKYRATAVGVLRTAIALPGKKIHPSTYVMSLFETKINLLEKKI